MAITVTWDTKIINVPKADTTLIQSNPTEIRELDINVFRLTLKDLEAGAEGMPFLDTHRHNTEVLLAGITYARVIEIINGYTVTFEDGQYAVNLFGANHNVGDVTNVNQVSIRVNNSAGLISSPAIEFAAYEDGIVVDITKTTVGTAFDIGTGANPCGNISDALQIAANVGVKKLKIIGDITFTTGHDLTNFEIEGGSQTKSIITIDSGAIVNGVEISQAEVLGTLDQNASLDHCKVSSLSFFEGFMTNCQLATGALTLGGTNNFHLVDCHSGVAGGNPADTPIIDMNGGGRDVLVRNYSGGIRFQNCATNDVISIDLVSGQVVLDNTLTAGDFTIRGVGKLTDNSNGALVNDGGLIRGTEITGIRHSLELLQLTGSAYGKTFYWNPVSGNDNNDGLTPNGAVATFTQVHSLVTTEKNDVIVIIGHTTITTPITISKNHVHIRGSGRDLRLVPSTPGNDSITITGDSCSVSNLFISTAAGGSDSGIVISNNRAILHKLWIDGCTNNGIEITNSSYSEFHHCDIEDNGNDGVVVGDTTRELLVMGCDIYKNAGNGVTVGGTNQDILRLHMDRIYDNIGYGLDILPSATNTIITGMTYITDNITGNIRDLGIQTHNQTMDMQATQSDVIWDETLSGHNIAGSTGNAITKGLGLMQENYVLSNPQYDSNSNLISATIKTYPSKADKEAQTNVLATYTVAAGFNSESELQNYSMVIE